jgi:hypothetical protein
MKAERRRLPGVGSVVLAVSVLAGVLVAIGSGCDGGDEGGAADADSDVDAGGDGGGDGGSDGGADGGSDTDVDTDTGDAGVVPCDPQICDDGCFAAGKKLGECIDGLCVCSGERNFGCDCRMVGGSGSTSLSAVLLGLVAI